MKRTIVPVLFVLLALTGISQEVHLTDSVIFIDGKPAAFFYKAVNNSIPRYNMEVYSLKGDLLINATVVKFNPPVDELKPFYYYEIAFPGQQDTASVYIEDEAFPLVLAKLIASYKLIDTDQISTAALSKFKENYSGIPALTAKIKEMENYLDETRHFSEQIKRDRSKPVKIVNDKIIMQDGVKIGTVREIENYNTSYTQTTYVSQNSNRGAVTVPGDGFRPSPVQKIMIFFVNGRQVDFEKKNAYFDNSDLREGSGKGLYDISKTKKITPGSFTDRVLKRVCYLIEAWAL